MIHIEKITIRQPIEVTDEVKRKELVKHIANFLKVDAVNVEMRFEERTVNPGFRFDGGL